MNTTEASKLARNKLVELGYKVAENLTIIHLPNGETLYIDERSRRGEFKEVLLQLAENVNGQVFGRDCASTPNEVVYEITMPE